MTQDDWEAMWGYEEPEPRVNGCVLLLALLVAVWAVIGVGVWWMIR